MAILTDTKENLNLELGAPVMAPNLIDGVDAFKGEQAYEYEVGDFRMIAGFYGDTCRYVCFQKAALSEPAFSPEDVTVCLMLIAPMSAWTGGSEEKTKTATGTAKGSTHPAVVIGNDGTTTDYQCAVTDSAGNPTDVLAWHSPAKSYLFAYCPVMPLPQPAIAVTGIVAVAI